MAGNRATWAAGQTRGWWIGHTPPPPPCRCRAPHNCISRDLMRKRLLGLRHVHPRLLPPPHRVIPRSASSSYRTEGGLSGQDRERQKPARGSKRHVWACDRRAAAGPPNGGRHTRRRGTGGPGGRGTLVGCCIGFAGTRRGEGVHGGDVGVPRRRRGLLQRPLRPPGQSARGGAAVGGPAHNPLQHSSKHALEQRMDWGNRCGGSAGKQGARYGSKGRRAPRADW